MEIVVAWASAGAWAPNEDRMLEPVLTQCCWSNNPRIATRSGAGVGRGGEWTVGIHATHWRQCAVRWCRAVRAGQRYVVDRHIFKQAAGVHLKAQYQLTLIRRRRTQIECCPTRSATHRFNRGECRAVNRIRRNCCFAQVQPGSGAIETQTNVLNTRGANRPRGDAGWRATTAKTCSIRSGTHRPTADKLSGTACEAFLKNHCLRLRPG